MEKIEGVAKSYYQNGKVEYETQFKMIKRRSRKVLYEKMEY